MQLPGLSLSRRVLLVEDDPDTARLSAAVLNDNGFRVLSAACAADMDAALKRESIDVVLLDVMLPGEDGFSICRRLRAASTVPIVMLSACRDETDRVVAFELGADDYVTKPFSARELVSRIRALLRRSQMPDCRTTRARPMGFSGWCIDPVMRQLHDPHGTRIPLTSIELDLLLAFCRHAGQVLSRERLLELIHGGSAASIERSIDVHVSRVRQKIEIDPADPALIRTVRLGGYVFTPAVELL